MSFALVVTLVVLVAAMLLFISERWPVDVVAMAVLCTLLATGVVTAPEALSGFASSATIAVAAMFVLSAGLQKSGVVDAFGQLLARIRWSTPLLFMLMLVSVTLSAFINNTAVVAILIPVVVAAAVRNQLKPSRLLIPLSYAAQMGGVCTLVGTSTNLLVDSLARDAGQPGFGIFEFAPLGLWFVGVGMAFIMLTSRFLLPDREHAADADARGDFQGRYAAEIRVPEGAQGIGRPGMQFIDPKYSDIVLREIRRDGVMLAQPRTTDVQAGDLLLLHGAWSELNELVTDYGLEFDRVAGDLEGAVGEERSLAEVMLSPRSTLLGKTIAETRFGHLYRLRLQGLHKADGQVRMPPHHVALGVGDILMVEGRTRAIDALRGNPGFVVLSQAVKPRVDVERALLAVGVLVAVIVVAAMGWLPTVAAALIGCVALVLIRGLTPAEAYAAIDWRVIILLAGVLPLGIALQKTGVADWLAANTLGRMGHLGPVVVLGIVYVLTAVMTELMSNNAAAVLIVPLALATAERLGIDPKPLLVAVAFAASTSFATPVGYQTNTMAYTAGGYRFSDFPRIGIPLNILFAIMAVLLIPRYFPF